MLLEGKTGLIWDGEQALDCLGIATLRIEPSRLILTYQSNGGRERARLRPARQSFVAPAMSQATKQITYSSAVVKKSASRFSRPMRSHSLP